MTIAMTPKRAAARISSSSSVATSAWSLRFLDEEQHA